MLFKNATEIKSNSIFNLHQETTLRKILPWAILACIAILLFSHSFEKWGDPIIDLGRDLYVPGRLLSGDLLYRNVLYNYGPVTPYLLSAIVAVTGDSLVVFSLVGILTGVSVLAALYCLGRLVGDEWTAFWSMLFFLVLSMFAWSTWGCDFVLPYSYAAIFSISFALWALFYLLRFQFYGCSRTDWWLSVGFLFAALGTKSEVGFAILIVHLVAAVLHSRTLKSIPQILGIGFLLGGFFVYLFYARNAGEHALIHENLGRFWHNNSASDFFAKVSGADCLPAGFFMQLKALGKITLLISIVVLFGGRSSMQLKGRFWQVVVEALAAAVYAILLWKWADSSLFAALPVIALLVFIYGVLCERRGVLTLLSLFVVSLSPRIFFNYSPNWYGFYLVVPSYIFIAYLFCHRFRQMSIYPRHVAYSFALIAVAILLRFGINSWDAYGNMTSLIETPKGRMYDFPTGRAEALNAFFKYVYDKRLLAGSTVVVFPEGISLNYFTGLKLPIDHYNFIPPEIDSPEEEHTVLAELQANKPDYIIILSREMGEFASLGFGVDYACNLSDWDFENYHLIKVFSGSVKPLWNISLLQKNFSLSKD
ncbi:MAG: glycosyltransferase family 39 protein [Geobacteraceae bacterium]|nr:glycosyltransferase family 39 protein [Geobacteraceae bacterium]